MNNSMRAMRYLGALVLVAAVAACSSDPTEASLGTPSLIQSNFNVLNLAATGRGSLTASVRDAQLNPLGEAITATSSNAAVVRVDSTAFLPELNESQFRLVAGSPAQLDSATVTLTGGGLTKAVKVRVAAAPEAE